MKVMVKLKARAGEPGGRTNWTANSAGPLACDKMAGELIRRFAASGGAVNGARFGPANAGRR